MNRILVGYDGSDASIRALEHAARLAKLAGCPLTVLRAAADRLAWDGVADPMPGAEGSETATAEEGADLARALGVAEVDSRTSLEAPDDALVNTAAEGFDLVVVGHRSLSPLQEFVLGSTAKSVVDRAHCSVLIVR